MYPLQFAVPVDSLEAVADLIPHVILLLVLANMVTRMLAHRKHEREVEQGADSVGQHYPHLVVSLLLVLASFAYLVVHHHGGFIMTVLVIGTVISDFFEVEARNVEARNELELERPKGALVAWALLLLYAAFQSLFFLVAPYWNTVV